MRIGDLASKVASSGVLTGSSGQIRRICSAVN